ncbi:MAG TPA: hypothetical protein VMB49_06945 [Acidobacteriaceae bacterium]|nr:hypothetical protein [Acidobacteriaceae bacterium]
MSAQKPSVKLEDWAVVTSANRGTYHELRPGNRLVGRAYGHRRIRAGMFIFSSPIVCVNEQSGIAETENTAYLLGDASRDYENWRHGSRAVA